MAKVKVSVTLDPVKLARARELVEVATLSQLLDMAIDRLIVDELERRHAGGYLAHPPEADEVAWAELARDPTQIADDVDWARLYGLSAPPMSLPLPRRGEVWLADLPGDKIRPVVVMTRGSVVGHLHSVVAAPVTSTIRSIPSEVVLSSDDGLLHASVANFDNLQLVARSRLVRQVGTLSAVKLVEACQALRFAVAC